MANPNKQLMKFIIIKEVKESNDKGRSSGLDGIIPQWITDDYPYDLKTDKALAQAFWETAYELQQERIIVQDVSTRGSTNFLILSKEGEKIYQKIKEKDFNQLVLLSNMIFISHSVKDIRFTSALGNLLESVGISAFVAHKDIKESEKWPEIIQEKLDICSSMVIVASKSIEKSA